MIEKFHHLNEDHPYVFDYLFVLGPVNPEGTSLPEKSTDGISAVMTQ